MTEIDNISKVLPLLDFDPDTYYYVQVLERKKGYTKQRYSELLIDPERLICSIKEVCLKFEARAYISVIPRSLKKFTVELGYEISKRIKNNVYQPSNFHVSDSVALSPNTVKKGGNVWLFDIDNPEYRNPVENWCKKGGINVKAIIPTFQGYHFLVSPFNPSLFGIGSNLKIRIEGGIEFDMKKDSNTLFYGIS